MSGDAWLVVGAACGGVVVVAAAVRALVRAWMYEWEFPDYDLSGRFHDNPKVYRRRSR